MNEADVAFIHEAVGGADRFQKLIAFAQEYAPEEVIDSFNEAVIAGDKSRVLAYLIRFGANQIEVIGEPA
tara:strand:+ start:304 stop:513 length:210 start_codon:yes stop_codon:yes gene_type:complete